MQSPGNAGLGKSEMSRLCSCLGERRDEWLVRPRHFTEETMRKPCGPPAAEGKAQPVNLTTLRQHIDDTCVRVGRGQGKQASTRCSGFGVPGTLDMVGDTGFEPVTSRM